MLDANTMHAELLARIPVLATLSDEQVVELWKNNAKLERWLAGQGLPFELCIRGYVQERLWDLRLRAEAEREARSRAAPVNRRRTDVDRLGRFMRDAADRLPPRLREVHALCVAEGRTLDEAARERGISRETVRTHLRRIRQLVRFNDATNARRAG